MSIFISIVPIKPITCCTTDCVPQSYEQDYLYKLENFGGWMSLPTVTRATFDLPESKEPKKGKETQVKKKKN